MRKLGRTAALLWLGVPVVILIVVTGAEPVRSDPRTKQQFQTQVPPYMSATSGRANSLRGPVQGQMSAWSSGQDPKWYGGNGSLLSGSTAILQAFFDDFLANLGVSDFPSRFLDCFNFDIDFGDLCYRRRFGIRIPIGFNMTYRFPMQQIHTRRFFQNRYLPEEYYDLLQASGYYENIWLNGVSNLHAPLAVLRASVEGAVKMNTKSWAAYIPAHGPIVPRLGLRAASFPLDNADERARYDGGTVPDSSADLAQLEYSIGPTLLHAAWTVVAQYFPVLQMLPCVPPAKLPPPFGSDDPAMIHITREPFMGYIFNRDAELRQDLTDWLRNPAVCQEWMLARQRRNIPYNMLEPNPNNDGLFAIKNPHSFLISLVPRSDVLEATAQSQLARFDRMCTNYWGGSIPFTTSHQLHDSPLIAAGKNFEKAIRLGVAIDKTFLSRTAARNYAAYYPLNKQRDAYQLTYPEQWDCKLVGTPGKPFAGANGTQVPGEYGLYSMTHWWTIPKCCLRFGDIARVVGGIANFGAQGFPTNLQDPQSIISRINPPAPPNIRGIIQVPANINIPGTGIPGMPTSVQNQNTNYPGLPNMPAPPF